MFTVLPQAARDAARPGGMRSDDMAPVIPMINRCVLIARVASSARGDAAAPLWVVGFSDQEVFLRVRWCWKQGNTTLGPVHAHNHSSLVDQQAARGYTLLLTAVRRAYSAFLAAV